MRELVFEVTEEEEGGFSAVALGEHIVTQGDTWEELEEMVLDATRCHFGDRALPEVIRLHLERDKVLMVA